MFVVHDVQGDFVYMTKNGARLPRIDNKKVVMFDTKEMDQAIRGDSLQTVKLSKMLESMKIRYCNLHK